MILSNCYRYFCHLMWRVLFTLIKKSRFVGLIGTFVLSIIFFAIFYQFKNDSILFGINVQAWQAVTGSLFAATIFAIITSIIEVFRDGYKEITENYYNDIAIGQGLHSVFPQKGSVEAQSSYRNSLRNAKDRVWAFGMTNGNLIDQHWSDIRNLLGRNSIDVVIAFWSPHSKLITPRHSVKERHILTVQDMVEKGSASAQVNWDKMIEERQSWIKAAFGEIKSPQGRLRIISISKVTNFSCFIIDNHVYFFPFLHGPHSNNEPMIYCDAVAGFGKNIAEHCHKTLNGGKLSEEICEVFFDSRGANENNLDWK